MKGVLMAILDGVRAVGMSTVSAVTRYDLFEPEEDIELAKWVEEKKNEADVL